MSISIGADSHFDVQIDVSTAGGSIDHGEPQSISTALGYAIGKDRLLVLDGLLHLAGVEITQTKLVVQIFQLDARNNIKRVDNVAQTLAHFTTFRVTDEAVAENFSERNFARHLEAEHDHSSNPEEQDVPPSL